MAILDLTGLDGVNDYSLLLCLVDGTPLGYFQSSRDLRQVTLFPCTFLC